MKNFITSDQHWGHWNEKTGGIITLANRPFKDVNHMNEHMVKAWNERVGPKDIVYHLGDIFWHVDVARKILPRLNGQIKLILGNHDWWYKDIEADEKFEWHNSGRLQILPAIHRININKTKIWLCHYPMRCWEGSFQGAMHLYGHVHGTIEKERLPRSMDMSVDVAGYQPWTIEEVWKKLDKDPVMPEEQRISNGLSYTHP
jgi:calcineurin-like phosphoesterase family protein